MTSGLTDTIVTGPFILAALLSLAAGAVSFASPCVVPLVPGYLSYLAGLVGSESGGPESADRTTVTRTKAVRATALFVLGFTVVFLAQSWLVLGVSHALLTNSNLLTRIGGGITIVMGFVMLGFVKPLQREVRLNHRPTGRILGAPLLGAVFGLGWVLCIGPTLLGVLSLSWSTELNGDSWRGLFLVLFYCAGLGIPFILLAIGFSWASTALSFLKRHTRTIQVVGAAMLIVLGLLMVSGLWTELMSRLQNAVSDGGGVLL